MVPFRAGGADPDARNRPGRSQTGPFGGLAASWLRDGRDLPGVLLGYASGALTGFVRRVFVGRNLPAGALAAAVLLEPFPDIARHRDTSRDHRL